MRERIPGVLAPRDHINLQTIENLKLADEMVLDPVSRDLIPFPGAWWRGTDSDIDAILTIGKPQLNLVSDAECMPFWDDFRSRYAVLIWALEHVHAVGFDRVFVAE